MKFPCLLFIFAIVAGSLSAQSAADWTWHEPTIFDSYADPIRLDDQGMLWTAVKSKLLRFDGINWIAFDFTDAGFTDQYIRDFAFSTDGKVWVSTYDRVYEFTIATNTWVEHNPVGNAVNVNGYHITVEAADRIWWITAIGIYKYDGIEWTRHSYYNEDVEDMEETSLERMTIDNQNQKWFTTSSAIGIDFPLFIPAGVILSTSSDTVYMNAASIGYPKATRIICRMNSQNKLVVVLTHDFSLRDNFLLAYENGTWITLEQLPVSGWAGDMLIDDDDKIYISFKDFVLKGKDGTWDIIPIDTSHIEEFRSIALDGQGGLYVGGNRGPIQNKQGAIGHLPELQFRASGRLYIDENRNGSYDTGEKPLVHHFIKTTNNDRITFSKNTGEYSLLFSTPGTYEIEAVLPQYFFYGNPSSGMYTTGLTLSQPSVEDQDFGFIPDTNAIDLAVTMTAVQNANPGFEVCYEINVQNLAPNVTAGVLLLQFDPLLAYNSSELPPASINGNNITFDIAGLDWLEEYHFTICFSVPPDPELMNVLLVHTATINPKSGADFDPSNNVYILEHRILGPIDPNYIRVSPVGEGVSGDIPVNTTWLEYTIHFQNVGTDIARTVVLSNPIDPDLDLLSLQVTGFSHPFEVEYLQEQSLLQWTFRDINLPDSLANETESNGFIKYRMSIGNKIPDVVLTNSAEIFFDYSYPLSTNTVLNTLRQTTGLTETGVLPDCVHTIVVTNDRLRVTLPSIRTSELMIYDLQGRHLFTERANQAIFETSLSSLQGGTYLVTLHLEGCTRLVSQLVYVVR